MRPTHLGKTAVVSLALAGAVIGFGPRAGADPNDGANATPGSLTCPSLGIDGASTSGSPAARAVQLVDTNQVFVFKGSPDWDFYQGSGSSPLWVTCTLDEPGPTGVGTLTVVGIVTPRPAR